MLFSSFIRSASRLEVNIILAIKVMGDALTADEITSAVSENKTKVLSSLIKLRSEKIVEVLRGPFSKEDLWNVLEFEAECVLTLNETGLKAIRISKPKYKIKSQPITHQELSSDKREMVRYISSFQAFEATKKFDELTYEILLGLYYSKMITYLGVEMNKVLQLKSKSLVMDRGNAKLLIKKFGKEDAFQAIRAGFEEYMPISFLEKGSLLDALTEARFETKVLESIHKIKKGTYRKKVSRNQEQSHWEDDENAPSLVLY